MKVNSYYFQKNNVWYFRKRIPYFLTNNRDVIYRRSLKKLLGKKEYYNNLLNGTLFSVANFINNNVEYFFSKREKVTLTEIDEHIKNILYRYKDRATNNESDGGHFLDSIGSDKAEIEQMRFDAIVHYDKDGNQYGGHTPEALEKEKTELIEIYKSENIASRRKKVNEILRRQSIISKEEYEKIPNDYLKVFEEALIKIEVDVINQDIENYYSVNKSELKSDSYNGFISNKELTEEEIEELFNCDAVKKIQDSTITKMKKQEAIEQLKKLQDSDNWGLLIDRYINSELKKSQNNTRRNAEIALTQFRDIMLGDPNIKDENGNIKYNRLRILDVQSLNEIKYLQEIIMEFTRLDTDLLKDMFRTKGTLYTNEFAYGNRKEYPKNLLSGLKTKIKYIKAFLESVKGYVYKEDPYKEIDMSIWNKLSISFKDLSPEDQFYNQQNQKLPLMSEDLSLYLYQKYDDTKIGKQRFTKHTGSTAHLFWSKILGIFTGARSEELAQIRLSHDFKRVFVEDREVYYFKLHISDPENQNLKNLVSKRNVPISDYLIELGFLNYIDSRLKAGKEYLFDLGVNDDKKRRSFPRNFNTTFKKFYKERNYDELGKEPTFHSLRAFFVAKFLKDEKNEQRYGLSNLKKLIGHTSDDLHNDITITSYFREALDLEFSKKLIDDMDFHIEEGYEKLRSLMKEKYPEILYSIDI